MTIRYKTVFKDKIIDKHIDDITYVDVGRHGLHAFRILPDGKRWNFFISFTGGPTSVRIEP